MSILVTFDGPYQITTPYNISAYKANQPIFLGTRQLSIDRDGKVTLMDAEVILVFAPFPTLTVRIPSHMIEFSGLSLFADNVRYNIHLVDSPESECKPLGMDDEYITLHLTRQLLSGPPCSNLTYATFHLLNFTDYIGDLINDEVGFHSGRFVLNNEAWRVTIDTDRSTSRLVQEASNSGGYALTHVGRLERISGRRFSSAQALVALGNVMDFLCFAKGDWSPPILITGYDKSSKIVWYDWSIRRHSPWRHVSPWWPTHEVSDILPMIFPQFMDLLSDQSIWGPVLKSMLNWYAHANARTSGADGAVVLLQAGLERLAWTYLTRHRQAVSEKVFGRMEAADSLRLLLNFCDIPTTIPNSYPQLNKFASKPSKLDGPGAFTAIRNWTVHPNSGEVNKRLKQTTKSIPHFEALQLGLEYFEMVLLHLCEYQGPYVQRDSSPFRGKIITRG